MEERRERSRTPLRLILTAILVASAMWLVELYLQPTWPKIRSFVLGYFLGTFVMEWIRTRADRAAIDAAAVKAPSLDAGTAASNR